MLLRALAGAGLALHALPALAPVAPPLARGLAIETRADGGASVALTFDDGPHPEGTPAMLGALAAADAPATFFLAGEQVERYPTLAAEIVAAGHEAALHCYRHRNQLRLTPRQIVEDMRRGEAAIVEACARTPRLYRPPHGTFSAVGLVLARRRWRVLLWSRWGRDWAAHATPQSIARKATEGIQPGDVILLHDADHYSSAGSWRKTVAAMPRILDQLERRSLSPAAIP
jgi:peptidoglycan-N-acetylglucosamine deacetylase